MVVPGITTLPHPSFLPPKNYNANFVKYLAGVDAPIAFYYYFYNYSNLQKCKHARCFLLVAMLYKEQGTHMVLDLLTWYMYVAPNTGWLYIITANT